MNASGGFNPENFEELMALHFDPRWGSPYWIEKAKSLPFDPLREVRTMEDLLRFGPFPESDLQQASSIRFIPKALSERMPEMICSETGGSTGSSKRVYFLPDEFEAGFIAPFLDAAASANWPRGAQWLFLGPSGPHIIGRVIFPICRALDSPEPLRIDFDPRWAMKLAPGSAARERYLDHLIAQALDILRRERVEVLFGTPPLLERLAAELSEKERLQIKAVHYGGMALTPDQCKTFRESLYPRAMHLSGYGNSLAGVAFEAGIAEEDMLQYFPSSQRLVIRVIPLEGDDARQRLGREVEYGERGQVAISRLDASFFIPNLPERDSAVRITASPKALGLGWKQDGIYAPLPWEDHSSALPRVQQGFY